MPKIEIKNVLKQKAKLKSDLVEKFKANTLDYVNSINRAISENQHEEHLKNIFKDFLRSNFYKIEDNYSINTDKRADSAIKKGENLLALIEAKKPSNKSEMVTETDINKKALWELTLYYLDKRYTLENHKAKKITGIQIRRLIITDTKKIFLIDAQDFDRICDGNIVKIYEMFRNSQFASSNNDEFYGEIRAYFSEIDITGKLDFISFDLECSSKNKSELQNIYRVLMPSFLLREYGQKVYEPNVLNDRFYSELLYIMGLKETMVKKKRVIQIDSSIKNSITDQLFTRFHTYKEYDKFKSAELSLELAIIWINRLLFIKLFEGQLFNINDTGKENQILSMEKIETFEDVSNLFFNILGKQIGEREENDFYRKFRQIPYLNSSLFERYAIEKREANINDLTNSEVAIFSKSVLGKKIKSLPLVKYIIEFFNSYCFQSMETDDSLLEHGKDIIDAGVLGLIFEKINGYEDGAHFTPSAITEFMCKEAIEQTIIRKINNVFSSEYSSIDDIAHFTAGDVKIKSKINSIINSLKICDPAVGSGHFLVSALNRLIEVKYRLGVLFLPNGKPFIDYEICILDDVLVVRDAQGKPFRYYKESFLSQKIQEMLFNEKKTLIEECLFGVDINSKAKSICELRLWIELLKNSYYTNGIMETLPNIDINIKCGNSLISKLPIKVGKKTKTALMDKQEKDMFFHYKQAVRNYKSEDNKYEKQRILHLIEMFKQSLHLHHQQIVMQEDSNEDFDWGGNSQKVNIYDNAFEWVFEFPELLDDSGVFIGFDIIVGNPPYGIINKRQNLRTSISTLDKVLAYYKESVRYEAARGGMLNIYKLFVCLSHELLCKDGIYSLIIPLEYMCGKSSANLRKYVLKNFNTQNIEAFPERDNAKKRVFDSVKMSVCILTAQNSKPKQKDSFRMRISRDKYVDSMIEPVLVRLEQIKKIDPDLMPIPLVKNQTELELCARIMNNAQPLSDFAKCFTGEIDLTLDSKYVTTKKTDGIMLCGAQVQKFYTTNEISQGEIRYLLQEKYLAENVADSSQHHKTKRIIMQGITGVNEKIRLKMSLCDEGVFCANSVNYIIAPSSLSSAEYLLGILNSKLMNWLFSKFSTNSNVNGYEVDRLPVRKSDKPNSIHNKVVEILSIKGSNPAADCKSLEKEIDLLVYDLYGLNEKESDVVEASYL